MVEKVIVAVDGGSASDAALEWVIDRARFVKLRLEITAVVRLDSRLPADAEAVFRTQYEDALARAKARVRLAVPGLAVSTLVRRGHPHESLITAARDSDLLVIGTDKISPLAGIMHGTLPLKVAGQARCTTIVVPVNWTPGTGHVVAGWSDDPTAEEALDFAAQEASRRNVALTIVHAWTPAPLPVGIPATVVDELVAANGRLLADAARRVEKAYPDLTVTQDLHAGSAAVAIVRAAAGASLVVVGSRGHGAVAAFFLGSVSHDVLLNMPAPVAVVPNSDEPLDIYPEILEEDL